AGNKVAGSIVDQHIERSIGEGGVHQAVDSFGRANVNDMGSNLAGQRVFELFGGILQDLGPAAANHQLSAELDHAPAHGLAEPGAAAGDQHAFSLEKMRLKHVASPCGHLNSIRELRVRGYKQLDMIDGANGSGQFLRGQSTSPSRVIPVVFAMSVACRLSRRDLT